MIQSESTEIKKYANKHIPRIIEADSDLSHAQILYDGSNLTTNNLKDPNYPLSMRQYILIYDTPESIGMKIPRLSNADDPTKFDSITVRHLGNIIGKCTN